MRASMLAKSSAVLGAAIFMTFGTSACATKKFVRQTVSPVEVRTSGLEKKTADHSSALGELENNVSRTDEKATEANRNATEANRNALAAGQSADRANQAALEARTRADAAATAAEQTSTRLSSVTGNIDNYQLVTTEAILFPVNKATLTKDAKGQLDQAVSNIRNQKNFVLEIAGFTDKTGSRDSNLALSQRRADAVVRYLTVEHQVPLRKIHVLGVGIDSPIADNRTRAGRKQNRRVEVKVYSLDLEGQQASNMNSGAATSSTGSGQMNSQSGMTSQSQTGTNPQSGMNSQSQTGQGAQQHSDQVRSRTDQTTNTNR